MTRISMKATILGLSASALAGCATPTYSEKAGYTPPPPIKPAFSTVAQAAPSQAPPPPAAPPSSSGAMAPVSPSAGPAVQSAPLPPAAPAPAASPPASSAYVPPAEHPIPAYRPPRPRPETSRLVADGKVVEAKGMFRSYVVQKGDHLDAIAQDLDTTREELVKANKLKAPYEITPGQRLKLPVAKAYVAQQGDTLGEVAKRFGVSAGELADLNNLSSREKLRAGDKLALPASFHDNGPIRLAEAPPRAAPPPRFASTRGSTHYDAALTSGPYVPSARALAAGERARRYAAAQAASPPSPGGYSAYRAPTTSESGSMSHVDVAAAGRGRFIWPVRGEIVSAFGVTGVGRRNDGIDIKSPQGTVVHAAAAGEVVYAGDQVPGFGNLVLVKHADGWVTAYAHLDRVSVQMKQSIGQGQEIGQVGISGGLSSPQLHFEIRYAPSVAEKAKPIDPVLVLPG